MFTNGASPILVMTVEYYSDFKLLLYISLTKQNKIYTNLSESKLFLMKRIPVGLRLGQGKISPGRPYFIAPFLS